jgi:hypothetical protein
VTILRHADRPGAFVHIADGRAEPVAVFGRPNVP